MATNLSSLSSATSTGTGLDVDTIVNNLVAAARAPETVWQNQQTLLQTQQTALLGLQTSLSKLDATVNSLKDFTGVFASFTAATTDNSIATASAAAGAAAGQHSLEVDQLATAASFFSNTVASSSTALANGSISIQVGSAAAVPITIDSTNNTLDKLAAQINQTVTGVSASVITDANGARLLVTGSKTGQANGVTLTSSGPLSFTGSAPAQNAKFVVDGIPLESATNSVTGAIAGVTLQLNAANQNKPITVSVNQNTAVVGQAIHDFVDNFNSIISSINGQFTYDPTTQQAGVLSGDSSVRVLQQTLLSQIGYSTNDSGNIATLASIGVTMQDDGTLKVDDTKLNAALQSNLSDVKNFFQGDGTKGFAVSFGNTLGDLTDSTTGALVVDLQGNTDSQKTLTDQISNFEVQIAFRRNQWLQQFSQVDSILRAFPAQQAEITAALGSVGNFNK